MTLRGQYRHWMAIDDLAWSENTKGIPMNLPLLESKRRQVKESAIMHDVERCLICGMPMAPYSAAGKKVVACLKDRIVLPATPETE